MERFWSKVDKSGDCWEWQAYKDRDGYGQFTFNKRDTGAHRVSYILEHGEIPEGSCVCHTCDNPGCVKPEHLFAASQGENMRDKTEKGRQSRGSKHYATKLVENDVRYIRKMLELGFKPRDIAEDFKVGMGVIYKIKGRKTWKHLE